MWRAFFRDVRNDTIALWSGIASIVFAIFGPLVVPHAYGLFLVAGAICFAIASYRAWLREYEKTTPRLSMRNNHESCIMEEGSAVFFRLLVENKGIGSIDNVSVEVETISPLPDDLRGRLPALLKPKDHDKTTDDPVRDLRPGAVFHLAGGGKRLVDVLMLDRVEWLLFITHVVPTITRQIPLTECRISVCATGDDVTPFTGDFVFYPGSKDLMPHMSQLVPR